MHQEFELKGRELVEVPAGTVTVAFSSAPTPAEHVQLRVVLGIDEHNLNSALDPEEISYLEFGPNGRATIIWKRPDPPADADASRFELASVGCFLKPGRHTVVVAGGAPPISRRFPELQSPAKLMLRMILVTVEEFVDRLRAIKRTAGEIQARLNRSLDNRVLMRMFDLSEDLIYYIDAIDVTGGCMQQTFAVNQDVATGGLGQ